MASGIEENAIDPRQQAVSLRTANTCRDLSRGERWERTAKSTIEQTVANRWFRYISTNVNIEAIVRCAKIASYTHDLACQYRCLERPSLREMGTVGRAES
jgi:hypothetical protein